jgi:phosphatidylinositol alpha-1,6-mannosyltransferase
MDIALLQDFFPKIGGAHLWIYEAYRRWPSPVRILTRRFDDSAAEISDEAAFDKRDHGALRIFRDDIAVFDINLLSGQCLRKFMRIVGKIRELAGSEPATIHCLRAFPEGLAGLLSKLRHPGSTGLVTFAHGEEILVAKSSRQLKFIASTVYRFSDLVIVNSKSTEALVRELCPKARIKCIHPGVDAHAFLRDKNAVEQHRKSWQWPTDTVVVSTVARMEPRKNQATVIRAIAELRREGLPLAYVCGSNGEERANLVNLASALGIQEWVRFTGVLTDDERALTYGASHIYAMPSIEFGQMTEGFGIVFLEAAAVGIPSVAGNVGGQAEAVLDGKTGIVVDGLDLSQVKAAIKRLALDAPLRDQMGQEGIKWAKEHDWSVVSEQIQLAIRECEGLQRMRR